MPAIPSSLQEKAAQLMVVRLGSNMPPPVTVAEDAARIEALLERCPIGGLLLFNGEAAHTPEVLMRLQTASSFPLLVTTDMERGVGQQVSGATVFPHAQAYAALDDAAAALEASARIAACEALACGIHVTFAPVADVNRDRRNPIIATRAFGEEPDTVARLVRAYIRGCQAEGLLTTAKHFPGHGGTHQDSHAELPVVSDDRATLERTDLVPFRAAIDAGVDLIMTAHISVPALDPRGLPATVSRPMLVEVLRGDLGFQGAVVTDSLLMGAIRATPEDAGEQAVQLVEAGVDMLLDVPYPEKAIAGLVRAVEQGYLSEVRLDEACARVWALKQRLLDRFGRSFFMDPAQAVAREVLGAPAHQAQAEDVARRAVTVQAVAGVLPLAPERVAHEGLLVVLVKPHRTRLDPPEQPLGAAVRDAYPGAVYREVGPEADEAVFQTLLGEAETTRHVVVAMIVKPAAWHAFGLLPAQQQFVEVLVERQPVVLASLGSPYVLDAFPQYAAHVCTYSDVAASQRALADVLAGR